MTGPSTPGAERRWRLALAVILGVAGLARLLYVVAQPGADPVFDRPILDGEVYVAQAGAWLRGEGGPAGAFYLAPGYPAILTVLLGLSGGSLIVVYLTQQVAVLVGGYLAAGIARRAAGTPAGLCAAILVVGYHPMLFFASCPLGETLAVVGLLASIAALGEGERPGRAAVAGAILGATALIRPNVLAILPLWIAWMAFRRRPRAAGASLAAALLVIAPVAVRNALESGSFVPISANAGLTFHHGNGPGADGVFTPVEAMGGRVADQRAEATRLARARSGEDLDDVEADRWWGREAIRARAADPAGTFRLVVRKFALTASSRELGLDYAPALDRDPWRRTAPVPFALLVGLLAAYPWIARHRRGRSLAPTWAAVLGMLATPLLFYVSSRYRLPLAALACIPGGVVLGQIWNDVRAGAIRAAVPAVATLVLVTVVSSFAPWGGDADRDMRATSHANRAVAWMERDRDDLARADLDRARELDPDNALAWYNFGVLLEKRGRAVEAAAAYRKVAPDDTVAVEAAGNLGRILIRDGRAREAIDVLARAVRSRPGHRACWSNLIVAHLTVGDATAAADAARAAVGHGVDLDPGLLAAVAAAVESEGRER